MRDKDNAWYVAASIALCPKLLDRAIDDLRTKDDEIENLRSLLIMTLGVFHDAIEGDDGGLEMRQVEELASDISDALSIDRSSDG